MYSGYKTIGKTDRNIKIKYKKDKIRDKIVNSTRRKPYSKLGALFFPLWLLIDIIYVMPRMSLIGLGLLRTRPARNGAIIAGAETFCVAIGVAMYYWWSHTNDLGIIPIQFLLIGVVVFFLMSWAFFALIGKLYKKSDMAIRAYAKPEIFYQGFFWRHTISPFFSDKEEYTGTPWRYNNGETYVPFFSSEAEIERGEYRELHNGEKRIISPYGRVFDKDTEYEFIVKNLPLSVGLRAQKSNN